jgi:hypothetical protein
VQANDFLFVIIVFAVIAFFERYIIRKENQAATGPPCTGGRRGYDLWDN